MKSFTSIVITGARGGIGETLALDYAAPGVALALSGRDAARLHAVAEACRTRARQSMPVRSMSLTGPPSPHG